MPRTPREIAAQVVAKVLYSEGFSNIVLDEALKSQPHFSEQDKGFCTQLVYGTLRFYEPLKESLRKAANKPVTQFHKHVFPHLLVAAYQLQHLQETVPDYAAVNSAVNTIKKITPHLRGFSNALLRNLGSAPHLLLKPIGNSLEAIAKSYGIPLFLAKAITQHPFYEDAQLALAGINQRPSTYFRLFGTAEQKQAYLSELENRGYSIRPHLFAPGCYALACSPSGKTGNVTLLPGFKEGALSIQDPASQIAALLLHPQAGTRVIDLCAAPGGKSAILAEMVAPTGEVIALDINATKVERIKENAQRLRLSIHTQVGDACGFEDKEGFDNVLLDAPCSSMGTTRRHPEVKFRFKEDQLPHIQDLQKKLLKQAVTLVKPGGALVYSVCSPLPEEGAQQIEALLKEHSDFRLESAEKTLPFLPANALSPQGYIQLLPHLHDCDAFFAARLIKSY